ncbi:hypothetical protein LUCX_214 [Xanthomonas phage vB_XciM_LucasX]|nr:hypothetical protein LUCX_214 [Xanthomonas phage vB_XciM_LucasX]
MSEPILVFFKIAVLISVWAMCARMLYLNEIRLDVQDRICMNPETLAVLCLIWPLWMITLVLMLIGTLLGGVLFWFQHALRKTHRRTHRIMKLP